jgi:methanethiol S-methyltransferase
MKTIMTVAYGLFAYAFFAVSLVYAIGFVGNLTPKSIDSGAPGPLAGAIVVDLLLLSLFAVQHSVMARAGFKRWWTRIVPEPIERSTYVLAASLVLALLLWQWQPIPEPVVWDVQSRAGARAIEAVFWLGWAILLIATFLINHFELFGLRQVFARHAGRTVPAPQFRTPLLYRYVRHPIYLGFLLGFWAAPRMTAGHLLFAAACTGYILLGIWFEERDLIARYGDRYRRYRAEVGMLLPWRKTASSAPASQGAALDQETPSAPARP